VSLNLCGAAPFGVEPGEDADSADLDRSGRHDLHAPQVGVVHRRYVHRPYRPGRGDQASQAFFSANTQPVMCTGDALARLRNDHDRNVPVRGADITLASRIPIDVIAFSWLLHALNGATKQLSMPVTFVRVYTRRIFGGLLKSGNTNVKLSPLRTLVTSTGRKHAMHVPPARRTLG
jgi:hypothetical protein